MSNNYIYTNTITSQTESNTTMENNNSIGHVEQVSMSFEEQRELLRQLKTQDTEIQELNARLTNQVEGYEQEHRKMQRYAARNSGMLVAARELFEDIQENGDLESYTNHIAAFVAFGMDPFTKVITMTSRYTVTVTAEFTVPEDFDESEIELEVELTSSDVSHNMDDYCEEWDIQVECELSESDTEVNK